MPLLQIGALSDSRAGGSVDPEAGVLIGARRPLGKGGLRAQVVSGREVLPAGGEDDDPDLVVGLGPAERFVELDQQGAGLRVLRLGTVEPDPRDAPVIEVS